MIFSVKLKLDLLNKDIDEITLLEILYDNIQKKPVNKNSQINLDTKTWKEFGFSDVFVSKRGKRLVKLDQADGEIAYISSTKINNGIDNYISPPNHMPTYSNAMTINNSGSVRYAFYHTYDFVCSDHCTVISISNKKVALNCYIAIFLKPILESMKPKYNFAREISDSRLSKEKISLPVDAKGYPDWAYMENYIKSLPYSSSL